MILVKQQVNVGVGTPALINVFGNTFLPDLIDMGGDAEHPAAEFEDDSFTFF